MSSFGRFLMISLAMTIHAGALAQTPPPEIVKPQNTPDNPSQQLQPDPSVLKPKPGVDPQIVKPPPDVGPNMMPVIPPIGPIPK